MSKLSNSVLETVKTVKIEKLNPFLLEKKDTKKVVKKVAKVKPLTKTQAEELNEQRKKLETKKASAKKRSENQQFANVQSAKRKTENFKFKTSAISNLLEVKRTTTLNNVDLSNSKNVEYLNECKKAINVILKNDELLDLTIEAVRTAKKGTYVTYYFEQLIQKIVKLKMSKNLTFEVSLQGIISAKKIA
jgi:hypothetical protein